MKMFDDKELRRLAGLQGNTFLVAQERIAILRSKASSTGKGEGIDLYHDVRRGQPARTRWDTLWEGLESRLSPVLLVIVEREATSKVVLTIALSDPRADWRGWLIWHGYPKTPTVADVTCTRNALSEPEEAAQELYEELVKLGLLEGAEDTEGDDCEGIACPWCGAVEQDLWDYQWRSGDGEEKEVDCGCCDRPYILTRNIDVSYSARGKK